MKALSDTYRIKRRGGKQEVTQEKGGPFQLPETMFYTAGSPRETSPSNHFQRSDSVRAKRYATANSGLTA